MPLPVAKLRMGKAFIILVAQKILKEVQKMARSWKGLRRPTEEAAIRRLERRNEPPAEWWRKWNELGDDWAREKAEEERKIKNLLNILLAQEDDETEKARRLARALGILNGGDR